MLKPIRRTRHALRPSPNSKHDRQFLHSNAARKVPPPRLDLQLAAHNDPRLRGFQSREVAQSGEGVNAAVAEEFKRAFVLSWAALADNDAELELDMLDAGARDLRFFEAGIVDEVRFDAMGYGQLWRRFELGLGDSIIHFHLLHRRDYPDENTKKSAISGLTFPSYSSIVYGLV